MFTVMTAQAETGRGNVDHRRGTNITRSISIIGTFVATVEIEVTNSSSDSDLASVASFTAAGEYTLEGFENVTANVTAFTSGTVTVLIGAA